MGEIPKWMLTYSDMVTLMLCVFVLIVSFANTDIVKYKAASDSVTEAFSGQPQGGTNKNVGELELPAEQKSSNTVNEIELEKSRLQSLLKSAAITAEVTKNVLIAKVTNGVKMEIMEDTGTAMFKSGGTELLDSSKQILRKIIPIMQETPYKITIEGHTDDTPVNSDKFPSNWELSSARAGSVVRFFLQEGGTLVQPVRFKAVGLADTLPLFENTTPENRAKNRRVSVVFEVF